jgi:Uma2 family endonuclease
MMVSMATITTTTTLLTFEEFEQLPDQPGKRELLRGELIEMPIAELKHNRTSHRIFRRLDAALIEAHARGEASELGEVYIEMGYKLAGDGYVQPDVSVTHARQDEGKYFGGAPAIAIEVVSPSNTAQALDIKTELYFEFGAREVWHVYPKTRHVVVYSESERAVTVRDFVRTPLLPGFELNVQEVLGA